MRSTRLQHRNSGRGGGFTFLEMMVVLALIGVITLAAFPLLHNSYRAKKEMELQRTLRTMRDAIDRYNDYAKKGMIEPWDLDWQMYPKDLEMLIEGVEVRFEQDGEPVEVKFLRKMPLDPMTELEEWDCRGYDDDPDERGSSCDNLYDVFSTSQDTALDGTLYSDW